MNNSASSVQSEPTPYAAAVSALKQSDAWLDLICPLPGGGYDKYSQYLRNRVLAAFEAGWNARENAK